MFLRINHNIIYFLQNLYTFRFIIQSSTVWKLNENTFYDLIIIIVFKVTNTNNI